MNRRQRLAQEKAQERDQRKLDREVKRMRFSIPPHVLRDAGPIITTDIGITDQHVEALKRQGLPVPAKVRCRFLIDTGAGGTVVRHGIAEKAGLKLISANAPVHGIGVDTTGKRYFGRIWFGMASSIVRNATHQMCVDTMVTSAELASADNFDGLIGRDVLQAFALTYNGTTGEFELTFKANNARRLPTSI